MTTLERRAYGLDRPWPERQRPQILDLDVWTALLRLDAGLPIAGDPP